MWVSIIFQLFHLLLIHSFYKCSHARYWTTHLRLNLIFISRNLFRSILSDLISLRDVEILVHAFITSCSDYCNSLYFGGSGKTLNKLNIFKRHVLESLLIQHFQHTLFIPYFSLIKHCMARSTFSELLQPRTSAWTLRSTNIALLGLAPDSHR